MEPISGEQHHAMQSSHHGKKNAYARFIPFIAIIVVFSGLGFLAGIQYQKDKKTPVLAQANGFDSGPTAQSFGGGPPSGQMRLRGAFGEVTAVSATSISIRGSFDDTVSTYSVTEDTKVSDDSTTASVSDIKVGATVMVRTTGTEGNEAGEIMLNPQQPGAGRSSQSQPQFQTN